METRQQQQQQQMRMKAESKLNQRNDRNPNARS
jgi:hypothetical protein